MLFRTLALVMICLPLAAVQAKEAAPPSRVAANNAVALKKMAGKVATVHGKLSRTSVSKSGHHFLNFYGSNLTVVCFRENLSKFKKGPADQFKNKDVEVTGKIENYRGKPQIKLSSPEQIRLGSERDTTPSIRDIKVGSGKPSLADVKVGDAGDAKGSRNNKKFELKRTGKMTWLSPAGLRYSGKDPQGLTRLEHVLRHASDQPRRVGSHGVFDGGNDQALATVDEAWKLARRKKIKPKNEGSTSAYTIAMGKRIGYLGGQSGSRRKHPPLKKVFIVVRTGTSDIITAFPR